MADIVAIMQGMTKACIDFRDCQAKCLPAQVCVARANIIRDLIAEARRAAFEEAAKICEEGVAAASEVDAPGMAFVCQSCANMIRALAEKN